MLKDMKKAIQDFLDNHSLSGKKSNFEPKIFGNDVNLRSASDNGKYLASVLHILADQKKFENFKRDPTYMEVLEHVSKEQGEEYLKILTDRDDDILSKALTTVLLSDSVGNPYKFKYEGINFPLSPTSLRYVKVSSDLKHLFGENLDSIAEIGCGYGGQCLITEELLHYRRFILFDLAFVNQLIKRYLDYRLMNGSYETCTINEKAPNNYDLVISNYAFSELPAQLQRVYINKVLSRADRGYLTMNSGIGGVFNEGKLSIKELQDLLPPFVCLEEKPITYKYNYIIVWGHKPSSINNYFTLKPDYL